MKRVIGKTLVVISIFVVFVSVTPIPIFGSPDEKGGEIRLYIADKDGKPVDLSGWSGTLALTPKDGVRLQLPLEWVQPKATKPLETTLGHGGQRVEMEGQYQIEMVVIEEHHEHGEHHPSDHEEAKTDHHDHGEAVNDAPYFKAHALAKMFTAVAIFKTPQGSKNAKGFEYPPSIPTNYKDAVGLAETYLKEIDQLIQTNQLSKVHSIASKISNVCENLPAMATQEKKAEVSKSCKETIKLFNEIDSAADAGKKEETILVFKKYQEKMATLKSYIN